LEREESELEALRSRLTVGLEQARKGDLAQGSGVAARMPCAVSLTLCARPGNAQIMAPDTGGRGLAERDRQMDL